MFRKYICAVLASLIIFISVIPAEAAVLSKSERYDALLTELENHLYGEEAMLLQDMFLQFSMLGSYKMSSCFALYVKILQDIEEDQYGQIFIRIETLKLNTEFIELLEQSEIFGTVDELEAYALGRQAESMEDLSAALTYYSQCPSFKDTFARLTLLRDNEFAEKYEKAFEYFVLDSKDGYLNAYKLFNELAEKNYQDSVGLAATCLLMLESYNVTLPLSTPSEPSANASQELSENTSEVSDDVSESTSAKPVATAEEPYPEANETATPSEWSEWTDVLPENVTLDLYEIEEKTQYSSRTVQKQYRSRSITTQYRKRTLSKTTSTSSTLSGWTNTGSYTDYGAWSAWSQTAVSASSTLDVETKTDTVNRQVNTYNYSRYRYYNTAHSAWFYSYVNVSGASYCQSGSGGWQYTSSATPLSIVKYVDGGVPEYAGCYYNQSVSTTTVAESVKLYRSRTKTLRYTFEKWSDWSAWGNSAITASSTVQVETKQVKGSWSRWQNNYIKANSSREVGKRTVYGDPTAWQDAEIVKSNTLDVSTRTVYRYRLR